jgi:hypothetical protein
LDFCRQITDSGLASLVESLCSKEHLKGFYTIIVSKDGKITDKGIDILRKENPSVRIEY